MRVLLSTVGSRGDVQPLVAVAARLRVAGHGASLCVPEEYCGWVESLGFPASPIGSVPWRRTAAGGPPPDRSPDQIQETIAVQFTAIGRAARGCDVIVAAGLVPTARSVAEILGADYVSAAWCPAFLPSPHQPPPLLPAAGRLSGASNLELWARYSEPLNARLVPELNRLRNSADLDPVHDVLSHVVTERPWLSADPVLAPWLDAVDQSVVQTGAWIGPDHRQLPGELTAFLEGGQPPVYFGFGSMSMPPELAGVFVQAARQVGRRVIISSGRAGLNLADRDPDCHVVGEVNLQSLFGRVAAVVHHGGAGTTTLAALAGVPQVAVPQRFDQPYFAGRVRDLGIGVAHAMGVPTADSLAAAIGGALQSEVAARARSVSAIMTKDGAQIAADKLTGISAASSHR